MALAGADALPDVATATYAGHEGLHEPTVADDGVLAVAEDAVARAARRDRLARRRKALGLTQEDLAGLLHVERSTVYRWERGECEPLPWIWPKLARALEVPADR